MDLLMLLLGCAGFVLALLYARACRRLVAPPQRKPEQRP